MKRKNITLHDEKVINHLNKQPNQSYYIEQLILKDLVKQNPITKEEVVELIKRYAKIDSETNPSVINSIESVLKFE